jgi:hypothetical protein
MIVALLLDLANLAGGFLLAAALLRRLPRIGDELGRFADRATPFGWIVGVVALVAAGYYLIVHLLSGPRVFHFEVVGLGVGVALLWTRLTGRQPTTKDGLVLLLAIFGLIAMVVGIQGLFTPD